MTEVKYLATLMCTSYSVQAGGRAFDGKPLPTWDDLGEDRQECWLAAAKMAIFLLTEPQQ